MHASFQSENLKGKDNLGDIGVDGRIMIYVKIYLNNRVLVWTGFVWLNMRSSSGLLWIGE
jgi:hypothetical protein